MRFSIPSLLTLLLFLSCEEALEYNPLDPDNNPDFVEPETIITVDNLEGTTLDTSTVTTSGQFKQIGISKDPNNSDTGSANANAYVVPNTGEHTHLLTTALA